MARVSPFLDPNVLSSIRNLPLRARTAVEGFLSGLHRSPFKGSSVEFAEYRPYMPGDDPRLIDWKVFARSDRYFVKEFEEESNMNCMLLLDVSGSMGYGSIAYTKLFYAATLAASLGFLAARQRDAVGFAAFDDSLREYLPPRSSWGHLNAIFLALERITAGGKTDLLAPLDRVAEVIPRRGMVVLISDFLEEIGPALAALRHFTFKRHNVLVFQVLDPAEIEFPFDFVSSFEDAETGERVIIAPEQYRDVYRKRIDEFTSRLRAEVEGQNVEYALLNTARPLDRALFSFLAERRIKA
jgi:uncharacterized protein (DUF58 family)